VQVNVVVHDKQNRPVNGLTIKDFELLDNGKAQPIAVFVAEAMPAPGSRRAPLPANTFTNQFVTEGARSGYAVILLDWRNTGWADQARAREHVIRMLRTIASGDKVALYVLGRTLRVLHEFTSEPAELLATLDRSRAGGTAAQVDPGVTTPWIYDASVGSVVQDLFPPITPRSARLSVAEQVFEMDRRVEDTLQAFTNIAAHLSGVPGRKSLIWVTSGFPGTVDGKVIRGARLGERSYSEQIDRAIRRLNEADVAVYAIDARGLPMGSPYLTIPTMKEFASRTGGTVFYNRNDLDTGLREALDDQLVSYTLAFYVNPLDGRSGAHRIRVKVNRPGMVARHRESYYEEASPAAGNPTAEIGRAMTSPVDRTSIPITAIAEVREDKLALTLSVDAGKLSFVPNGPIWESDVQLLVRFAGADGSQQGRIASQKLNLRLTAQAHAAAMRDGLTLQSSLPVAANAAGVRLLLIDARSKEIGTLSIPLRKITPR
jgi:VWFA-related protein